MIPLDDTYSLKSDSTCWTLVRTKTAKSGKRAGETYHEDIGYYAIPEQAVERWYRELQREVDAEPLKSWQTPHRSSQEPYRPLWDASTRRRNRRET